MKNKRLQIKSWTILTLFLFLVHRHPNRRMWIFSGVFQIQIDLYFFLTFPLSYNYISAQLMVHHHRCHHIPIYGISMKNGTSLEKVYESHTGNLFTLTFGLRCLFWLSGISSSLWDHLRLLPVGVWLWVSANVAYLPTAISIRLRFNELDGLPSWKSNIEVIRVIYMGKWFFIKIIAGFDLKLYRFNWKNDNFLYGVDPF